MKRAHLASVLFAIAAAPFAAIALVPFPQPATDPAPLIDAGFPMISTSVVTSSSTSSSASSTSSSASIVATAVVATATVDAAAEAATSAQAKATRAQCLALAQAHANFISAHQRCTSDADCESVNASCGLAGVCGAPMNKSFRAGLTAKDDAFTGADCMMTLAAPCPTCAYPGVPKCVGGKCALVK
ncbi:hypothetical protein BH09MYX1_BH09MYX1_55090 [soil metagenome]